MSTLENIAIEERLREVFEDALFYDIDLRNALAYATLTHLDYIKFCKIDAWDLLDEDALFEEILRVFYDMDGFTYDIRILCDIAFNTQKIIEGK